MNKTDFSTRKARGLEHSKGGLAILVVTILIDGGYAFSFADVSFPAHVVSCNIGIGVLEESAKCFAALLVFAGFYRQHGFRYSLTPLVIAVLGFGGGEALHYLALTTCLSPVSPLTSFAHGGAFRFTRSGRSSQASVLSAASTEFPTSKNSKETITQLCSDAFSPLSSCTAFTTPSPFTTFSFIGVSALRP
jgi:hypothetical protein